MLSGPFLSFRASRPALAPPERECQRSSGVRAVLAARAARWGRLETVQKAHYIRWVVALRENLGRAGLGGLGCCRVTAGVRTGLTARGVGRYGRATRDAGQLWDANPLESLALGS